MIFTDLGSNVVNEKVVLRCMENVRGEVTQVYILHGDQIFFSPTLNNCVSVQI